jgi:hypothetical protein
MKALIFLLVIVTGCESQEEKYIRLEREQMIACLAYQNSLRTGEDLARRKASCAILTNKLESLGK